MAHDVEFRESLARALTAEGPTYESYVKRKRREGTPPLPREEWERYVFGEEGDPGIEGPHEPQQRSGPRVREREPTEPRPKRLFSVRETRRLPKWAAQSSSDPNEIFAQAQEAYPQMLDWLDRGEGVDKEIGAHVVRRDRDPAAPVDLSRPGPIMIIAPNKDRRESERKVTERYSGDWREGAVDIVRATIAVDRYDQLAGVVDALKRSGLDLVSKPRNRFREPTSSGYRDVVLSARLPNGHVMEIQLHLKDVLRAKEEAHREYTRVKGLDDQISGQGRGPQTELTQEQLQLFDEAQTRMKRLYEGAWQTIVDSVEPTSIFDTPPTISPELLKRLRARRKRERMRRLKRFQQKKKAAEEGTRFYEMDGLPVRWVRPKLPMIEGGSASVPVDSLAVFMERAREIDEDDFDELVAARMEKRRSLKLATELRRLCETYPGLRRELKVSLED